MPPPIPCLVKTRLRPSQRCTSLASLPRFKLFLKNGAGGVHDQLWQKYPVETNERIRWSIRGAIAIKDTKSHEGEAANNQFLRGTSCPSWSWLSALSISNRSTREPAALTINAGSARILDRKSVV